MEEAMLQRWERKPWWGRLGMMPVLTKWKGGKRWTVLIIHLLWSIPSFITFFQKLKKSLLNQTFAYLVALETHWTGALDWLYHWENNPRPYFCSKTCKRCLCCPSLGHRSWERGQSHVCAGRCAVTFPPPGNIPREFLGVLWKEKKSAFITTSSNTRGSSRSLRSCFYIHCLININQAIFLQEIHVTLVAFPSLNYHFIFHSLPISSNRTCIIAGCCREKEA